MDVVLTFVVMHLFVLPSSAAYNSYYDRDEAPTGGLAKPPPVNESLYWAVNILDVLALTVGFFVTPVFALVMIPGLIASRLYSNNKTRVKQRPVAGFLWVMGFQGMYTYIVVYLAGGGFQLHELSMVPWNELWLPGAFSSLLVAGSYPLSQVYQFKEDAERGDTTFSMVLGYSGTFIWAFLSFTVGVGFLIAFFYLQLGNFTQMFIVTTMFGPCVMFVGWWFLQVRKDTGNANHINAMRFGTLAGIMGNSCFLIIGYMNNFM